jgi:hypothetical protein
MSLRKLAGIANLFALFCALLVPSVLAAQNQVLGEVEIQGKTNIDKTSGVWVDGQYVGYVKELKGDKKLLLLPGDHQIAVRQAGYIEQVKEITVEPGRKTTVSVRMQNDPRAQFPKGVTSEVKLDVTPNRAAVFVDEGYVGTIKEFSGLGRAMVIAPGKHNVKIALAGYQDFTTEINLRPKQEITIKTDLTPGSITQAGSAINNNATNASNAPKENVANR